MLDFLRWYLILTLFALAAVPLGWTWLRHLPDRGWGLLRPLSLLLGGVFVWLAGTMGLLTLNAGSGFGALAILAGVGFFALQKWGGGWSTLVAWLKEHRGLILTQEVLFFFAFAFWTWYRIHDLGGISHTEQPMDFALMNAIRRGGEMPPNDPWLSGFAISYYYMGYLIMALVGAMSGVARGVDYNLAFASLPALASVAMFSVVYNLVPITEVRRKVGVTLLGVLLLVGVSNLTGILTMAYHSGTGSDSLYQFFAVNDLPANNPNRGELTGWWWWAASRTVSDYNPDGGRIEVIDEFPFFSYLLGDMHPHVLALPFALLGIGVSLNALLAALRHRGETLRWRGLLLPPDAWDSTMGFAWFSFALTAIILGAMSMLNTWDFPTQAALIAIVWLVAVVLHAVRREGYTAIASWAGGILLLSATALVLYLPFYFGFSSQADGIRVVPWSTSPQQFLLMFGLFGIVMIPLLLTQVEKIVEVARRVTTRMAGLLLVMVALDGAFLFTLSRLTFEEGRLAILVAAGWVLIPLIVLMLLKDEEPTPLVLVQFGIVPLLVGIALQKWTLVIVATLLTLALAALWARVRDLLPVVVSNPRDKQARAGRPIIAGGSSDNSALAVDLRNQFTDFSRTDVALIFALMLSVLAFLLVMGTEIFYIKDGFGGRMNTVFKLYYQAWMLLAIASTFGIVYLSQKLPVVLRVVQGVVFGLVILGCVWYPIKALSTNANFNADAQWDARVGMEPDRLAAINWLDQIPGQVVILEKPGGAYQPSESALAGFTGHSTPLGWKNHEGQWRGDYDEIGRREPLIERIYTTTDVNEARDLLNQLDVDYVALTPQEVSTYNLTGAQLDKFNAFMTPVFQQGAITILGW